MFSGLPRTHPICAPLPQRLGMWSTADLDRWNEQTIDLYLRRRTWLDVENQLKRPGRVRQGRRRLGWAPLKSLIFLPEGRRWLHRLGCAQSSACPASRMVSSATQAPYPCCSR